MKKRIPAFFCIAIACTLNCTAIFAQSAKPIAQNILDREYAQVSFAQNSLFTRQENPAAGMRTAAESFASKSAFAKIDHDQVQQMFIAKSDNIALTVPYTDGRDLELELYRVDIFAEGFHVSSPDNAVEAYNPGVFYRGIIKGDINSLVAVSIFSDQVMAIISSQDDGNINVGKYTGIGAADDDYMIFSDKDITVANPSSCATPEDERFSEAYQEALGNTGSSRTVNIPRVYVEADNALYLNKGSVTATSDYLTGVFNNSSTIYANDGINIVLSEIFVWTTADGYASGSSSSALSSFMSFRTTFNGDVAQLCALDPGGLGGVAATINGLCNSNKYCYSDIDPTYSTYPTYSWTVMVFTHELGHLFGSFHTQWCGWPGGAIDNCYTTEGGCSPGPAPVGGGTIMSYCHLTGYGINFVNGFGPYPKAAIIGAVDAAGCLSGGGGTSYCASEGTVSNEEWIDFVRLGTINRISGDDGGYYDGTASSTNLKKGTTKKIKVSAGMSGGPWTEYFKVWIDWNHDYDFTDAGEEVYSTSTTSTGTLTGSFVVPTSATLGMTRMRVSMKYNAAPSSCETFDYGEVEDYTVNIKAALPYGELIAAETELTLYPNPAENICVINLGELAGGSTLVQVIDMTGNIVLAQTAGDETDQLQLDISNLAPGIYSVKIIVDGDQATVKKLMKI